MPSKSTNRNSIGEGTKNRITNSDDVFKIMHAVLLRQNKLHRQKEYFWSIGLTTASDIAYLELVAIGGLNTTLIDPVEVFSFAVQKKCKRMILIHNHPGGQLKPSKADRDLLKGLQKGASYLKIKIEDFLIITEDNGYLSFLDKGIL